MTYTWNPKLLAGLAQPLRLYRAVGGFSVARDHEPRAPDEPRHDVRPQRVADAGRRAASGVAPHHLQPDSRWPPGHHSHSRLAARAHFVTLRLKRPAAGVHRFGFHRAAVVRLPRSGVSP